MNTYKVLVFDLDGTLFVKDQIISKNAAAKIIELQERGFIVGLATGRFYNELSDFIQQLKLKEHAGFLICANGAQVIDLKSGSMHQFATLSKQECLDLIELCQKFNLISYVHEGISYRVFSSVFLKKIHSVFKGLFSRTNIPLFMAAADLKLEQNVSLNNNEYHKVCFVGTKGNLHKYIEKVKQIHKEYAFYSSSNHSLEIVKEGVNKFSACYWYLSNKNISIKDVVFFGDGGNDNELLQNAGLGIAMKNALPSTKQAAHKVSSYTNHQDGVYKELEKLFG